MRTVHLSPQGQIAIPKSFRKRLGFEEGAELSITVRGTDLIVKKARPDSWQKWRGSLKGTNALQQHEQEHWEEVKQDEKNT